MTINVLKLPGDYSIITNSDTNGISTGGTVTIDLGTKNNTSSSTTGSLVVYGDMYVHGNIRSDNQNPEYISATTGSFYNLFVTSPTNSTSTDSGALTVVGGVGIGQDVNIGGSTYLGGNLYVNGTQFVADDTIIKTSNSIFALSVSTPKITSGGSGLIIGPDQNDPYISLLFNGENSWLTDGGLILTGSTGNFIQRSTTQSLSTKTGAITVIGGVGIGKNLHVGGDFHSTGTIYTTNNIYSSGTIYTNGSPVISSSTIRDSFLAGRGITISTGSGIITISLNASLQDITDNGFTTTNVINITNGSPANTPTDPNTTHHTTNGAVNTIKGALQVAGGVTIGQGLYVGYIDNQGSYGESGLIYSSGSVVVTQASIPYYAVSELIADSDISISTSIGVVTIACTATLQSITDRGSITSDIIYLTNQTQSYSTTTGALVIAGGVGVGGILSATNMYSNGDIVVTSQTLGMYGVANIQAGNHISISPTSGTGTVIIDNIGVTSLAGSEYLGVSTSTLDVILTNLGVTSLTGSQYLGVSTSTLDIILTNLGVTDLTPGSGIAVSTSTGSINISSIDTLQTVAQRGNTTTNTIKIFNDTPSTTSTNGALIVAGGVGIGGDLNINGMLNVNNTISSLLSMYSSGSVVLTEASLQDYGVVVLHGGTGTSVSPNSGNVTVWSTATFQNVTDCGFTTTNIIHIQNGTPSQFSSQYLGNVGALKVDGGIVTGGDISSYQGNLNLYYGSITLDYGSITLYQGSLNVTRSASIGNLTITGYNSGDQLTVEGNSTLNGTLTVTSDVRINGKLTVDGSIYSNTFQVLTTDIFSNPIDILDNTNATSTTTGALTVVGGVGVGGNLYASSLYSDGSIVLTEATLNKYGVAKILAGNGIAVSTSVGVISVSSNATLQQVTGFGNITTNAIKISNTTPTNDPLSGALTVAGGVGVGQNIHLSGNIYGNSGYILLDHIGHIALSTSATNAIGSGIQIGPTSQPFISLTYSVNGSGYNAWLSSGGIDLNGQTNIFDTTTSDSTDSGALTVFGGVGVGGDLNVGGSIFSNGAQVITTTTQGISQISSGSGISVAVSYGNATISAIDTLDLVTSRGNTSTNSINITDNTPSISTLTGALTIAGGVGVGGNLNVGGSISINGPVTFGSPVTFNGTATYVNSTNTVYTDNMIELHTPPGGVGGQWSSNDHKDIGVRFHYYNGTDLNAALVLANDSKMLEWYNAGAESTTGTFAGANYGGFRLGNIQLTSSTNATSTTSGALIVAGGVGVGGDLYASTVYSNNAPVVTTDTLSSYSIINISTGSGIAVSTSSGIVTVSSIDTLQLVTNRGNTTTNKICITDATNATSTTTGALIVTGGVGIGANLYALAVYSNNALVITTATIKSQSVTSLSTGSGIAVSASSGTVNISSIDTLQLVTDRGNTTTNKICITNATPATSTTSGALIITGGVGIGGDLNVGGNIYATNLTLNGATVVTTATLGAFSVVGITTGSGIAISTSSGIVNILSIDTLQLVTDRGNTTTNKICITNATPATSPTSGALIVTGGAGVSGNMYIGGNLYSNGAAVVTTATLVNENVMRISAGSGISVTTLNGIINIANSDTLQLVTNRGNATTNTVYITNTTTAISTTTGALIVTGGVGIGGTLVATSAIFPGSASSLGAILTNAAETTNIINAAPSATTNVYLNTGAVQFYTVAATTNWTLNIAFSTSTSINSALSIGQSTTIAVLAVQGATAYYPTLFTIDGTTLTPYWQGGTPPAKGNATGIDVYTYTIIKTGNALYTVLATQTQF